MIKNQTITEIKKLCIKEAIRDILMSLKKAVYHVLRIGPFVVSAFAIYVDSIGGTVKGLLIGSIIVWISLCGVMYFLPDKSEQHDRMFSSKVACLVTCYLKEQAAKFGLTNIKLKEGKGEAKQGKLQVGAKVQLSSKDKFEDNNRFMKSAAADVEFLSKRLGKIYPIAINIYK